MKIQIKSAALVVFESALFRTTTSVIIGEHYILLVDPNWLPMELDFIETELLEIGKGKEKYLLFTHSDYDHIIGYGKFKSYKTIASLNLVNNTDKEKTLQYIHTFDDQYYIKRDYAIEYPNIDISIGEERKTIQLGKEEYIIYQAKGHNKDSIIAYNKSKGILIAGDYLSNIEFPYIYDNWENYLKTLSIFEELLHQYPVKILVPGHGDFTSDRNEMITRINESKEYIAELEESIVNKKKFNEKRLFERYHFPIIMNQFHQNNIKLMTSQLNKNQVK